MRNNNILLDSSILFNNNKALKTFIKPKNNFKIKRNAPLNLER